jgi:hypothetical protein
MGPVVDSARAEIASYSLDPDESAEALESSNGVLIVTVLSGTVTVTSGNEPPVTATFTITSVTSSEPIDGQGDGDTSPDWEIDLGALTARNVDRMSQVSLSRRPPGRRPGKSNRD